MPQEEASILWVEGKNDLHAVRHLLSRHGVDWEHIPVDILTPGDPEDEPAGGRDPLLEGMQTAVMTSTGRSAGFVLDADEVAQDRWRAVCSRLEGVGLTPPNEIPGSGYVDHASAYQARVGVWLMPDNRRSGALEDFLQDLVASRDSVLQLAEESTDLAKSRGCALSRQQAVQGGAARLARMAGTPRLAVRLGHTRPVLPPRQSRRLGLRRVVQERLLPIERAFTEALVAATKQGDIMNCIHCRGAMQARDGAFLR